jgi:hypothetical protein
VTGWTKRWCLLNHIVVKNFLTCKSKFRDSKKIIFNVRREKGTQAKFDLHAQLFKCCAPFIDFLSDNSLAYCYLDVKGSGLLIIIFPQRVVWTDFIRKGILARMRKEQ